jgi:hypothetical protein
MAIALVEIEVKEVRREKNNFTNNRELGTHIMKARTLNNFLSFIFSI